MNLACHPTRRKAVAGILAGIIIFAMIFTAGIGLVLYQLNLSHQYDLAQAQAQQSALQKSGETVAMVTTTGAPKAASSCSTVTNIGAWVNSTSSSSLTLVSLYLSDSSGTLLPAGTMLNSFNGCLFKGGGSSATSLVKATSITLNPGDRVWIDSGNPPGGGGGGVKTVGVITQRGNSFTALYPPLTAASGGSFVQTITTTLSSSVIVPTGSVYDTAVISGVADATNYQVTYYYFGNPATGIADGTCDPTKGKTNGGGPFTLTSSNSVPNSNTPPFGSVTYPTAGSYSWDAVLLDPTGKTVATSPCEPLSVTSFQSSSTTTLTLQPVSGKLGTSVVLTGNGYLPGSTVTLTFDGNTVAPGTATVDSTGKFTTTITVPTTDGGVHIVEAVSGSIGALALFNVTPPPTLALNPSTGFPAKITIVTLSGSNYANSFTYDYCLSTSTSPVNCVGTTSPFTSLSDGSIPSGLAAPTLVVSNQPGVTYNVIVFDPNTKVVASSATFTNFPSTAQSAFGLGFISLDFNTYRYYQCASGSPGSGCTLSSGSTPFNIANAPLAYSIPITKFPTVFSATLTNTDPTRNIVLSGNSLFYFLTLAGEGGSSFKAVIYGIGLVDWKDGSPGSGSGAEICYGAFTAGSTVAIVSPCVDSKGGILLPAGGTTPVTIWFTIQPPSSNTLGLTSATATAYAGSFYLVGIMGTGCTGVSGSNGLYSGVGCTGPVTFISQNEPLVVTLVIPSGATTTTVVGCSPSTIGTVSTSSSTCIATVSGSSPTGIVSWSSTSATGIFSVSSCTLSSGSCSVKYTDTTAGTPTITASYGGDSANQPSSGPFALTVAATTISLNCSPASLATSTYTTCVATVSGDSPTGTVTFSSSASGTAGFVAGSGIFTPPSTCMISSGVCSVSYTQSTGGTTIITAKYIGDSNNPSVSSSEGVVFKAASSIAITGCTASTSCSVSPPNTVMVSGSGPRTVTITFTVSGTGPTPTGTLNFDTPTRGSLSASSCTLMSGSCSVIYSTDGQNSASFTVSYAGDANYVASSNTVTVNY